MGNTTSWPYTILKGVTLVALNTQFAHIQSFKQNLIICIILNFIFDKFDQSLVTRLSLGISMRQYGDELSNLILYNFAKSHTCEYKCCSLICSSRCGMLNLCMICSIITQLPPYVSYYSRTSLSPFSEVIHSNRENVNSLSWCGMTLANEIQPPNHKFPWCASYI